MKFLSLLVLAALVVSGCDDAYQSTPATNPKGQPADNGDRDNNAMNERDRDSTAKTPLHPVENRTDVEITTDIRRQVVASEMSFTAHSIKINSQNGKVTLRGPVKSAEEKKQIEDIAHAVAGSENVDSQLEIEQQP